MNNNIFGKTLVAWYKLHGRHDLPWQKNTTPYRVWVSEIMLQQTQVSTVIPYYHRFMRTFPTLKSLALASEDDVLAHWSGLGYYARARNLHRAARIVLNDHNGHFPDDLRAITKLPGIGRSTAGAILSFSKKQFAVILDGNVKRVLTRVFAFDEPINKTSAINHLWDLATKLTPQENAHHYNQAIMDLGATLCTRTKPKCTKCPFIKTCEAYAENNPTKYPIKTPKKPRPSKHTQMLVFCNNDSVLLYKRPSQGIWGGLWSFPEISNTSLSSYKIIKELPMITHQFTHFTLEISPVCIQANNEHPIDSNPSIWYTLSSDLPGGIAAPVAKILKQLEITNDTQSAL